MRGTVVSGLYFFVQHPHGRSRSSPSNNYLHQILSLQRNLHFPREIRYGAELCLEFNLVVLIIFWNPVGLIFELEFSEENSTHA